MYYNNLLSLKKSFLFIIVFSFSSVLFSQSNDNETQDKKERKARSSLKVSAGVNLNSLSLDSNNSLESKSGIGYNLGLSYKRGRFFYYEIGARYNNRYFDINDTSDTNQNSNTFSVSAIDVPLTGGINITSFADRLVGVRVFVSAIPSFTLNNSADKIGLDENDINNFMFYGQGGVGIDILFFFIEVGFNYGFDNIIDDINNVSTKSNPGQGFFNIGFRF